MGTTSCLPGSTPAACVTTARRRSSRSSSSTGSSGREAFGQTDVFAAAIDFARSEAIIPAPESAHAIKGAIDAARRADEAGTEQVIIFNLSGHGHFDMGAYDAYLHGRLEDFELPEAEIQRALKAIEELPKPAGVSV